MATTHHRHYHDRDSVNGSKPDLVWYNGSKKPWHVVGTDLTHGSIRILMLGDVAQNYPMIQTFMKTSGQASFSKLAHYRAWAEAWLTTPLSKLSAQECLSFSTEEGVAWLNTMDGPEASFAERVHSIVACFKTAAKARLFLLGGNVPPSRDEFNVLSESFDPRVLCSCHGLFPVDTTFNTSQLNKCGCKAIERMVAESELVNSKEDEWNSSKLFTSEGLSLAVEELALCHADVQPSLTSCCDTQYSKGTQNQQGNHKWPVIQAPDRKPHLDCDLEEDRYSILYPTTERIRLSADAKYFFACAGGRSLVDPGIQMAIADSGNDVLIGDYCDAATDDCLLTLQKAGAAAFAFLKLCVCAGLVTKWQFDQLVAQTIQFRVISYWRDHALSQLPTSVYGSRMTGLEVHRRIDLGMVVGIVSASLATGESISSKKYMDLVGTCTLINDLVDFRGDTWRNQRENVVLRGVRGCLCVYLDGLLSKCIQGAATMVSRGKISASLIFCFSNWMLMSSGHKVYETMLGTQLSSSSLPCKYKSKHDGAYEKLLEALECYETLGKHGPSITMKRKDLQTRYSEYRMSSDTHTKWLADATRAMLHPDTLRRLVDVVHYQWTGDLGDVKYCK